MQRHDLAAEASGCGGAGGALRRETWESKCRPEGLRAHFLGPGRKCVGNSKKGGTELTLRPAFPCLERPLSTYSCHGPGREAHGGSRRREHHAKEVSVYAWSPGGGDLSPHLAARLHEERSRGGLLPAGRRPPRAALRLGCLLRRQPGASRASHGVRSAWAETSPRCGNAGGVQGHRVQWSV